ncbi:MULTISPECIES: hypothetical protein [Lentilactobacillus]|nr:hypothetical protein [Lentilactobacillus parabuchneri]MBW0246654.1 hypothetical protein [Lentilactobacillus parabuchneri]
MTQDLMILVPNFSIGAQGNGDDDFGGTSLDDLNASEGDNGSWSFVNDDGLAWGVSSTGKIHAPGDPIQ